MALELQKIIRPNQLLGIVGYQPALLEHIAALLFGTTIPFTAFVMGLEWFCFEAK